MARCLQPDPMATPAVRPRHLRSPAPLKSCSARLREIARAAVPPLPTSPQPPPVAATRRGSDSSSPPLPTNSNTTTATAEGDFGDRLVGVLVAVLAAISFAFRVASIVRHGPVGAPELPSGGMHTFQIVVGHDDGNMLHWRLRHRRSQSARQGQRRNRSAQ